MNNPILTKSEEEIAPWNRESKIIEVNISQCLSTTTKIEVPKELEDYDSVILLDYVREQIVLPSECINKHSQDCWYVDDFCVIV